MTTFKTLTIAATLTLLPGFAMAMCSGAKHQQAEGGRHEKHRQEPEGRLQEALHQPHDESQPQIQHRIPDWPDRYRFHTGAEFLSIVSPLAATLALDTQELTHQEIRMRHYEKLARWPERLVALGDAVCGFNPVYGQGISVSAMAAVELGKMLGKGNGRLSNKRLPNNSQPMIIIPTPRSSS